MKSINKQQMLHNNKFRSYCLPNQTNRQNILNTRMTIPQALSSTVMIPKSHLLVDCRLIEGAMYATRKWHLDVQYLGG
jgi:hypothetical protein